MDGSSVLVTILIVAGICVCAVVIWALTEAVKSLRSVRVLADDIDTRLVPLLDKADITVDAINAELLRIDEIVSRVEDVSEKVSATSNVVQGAVSAPLDAVNLVGGRLRHWLRSGKAARK